MKGLGADSDYIGFDGFWSETLPYPYAKELGQAFQDSHDGNTSGERGPLLRRCPDPIHGYRAGRRTRAGKVRDEVFNGTFPGTTMGDITYNDQGISEIPLLGFQWIGGERNLRAPKELSVGPTETFKPWDQR